MVHIKKVDIFGFKSFGFKNTTVNFEPGLVSISGPNGSGKSNILDAIIFALGENKAKIMRASNGLKSLMHDIDNSRRGVKLTRVSVLFDNSDRKIPIDSDSVTITREMNDQGESIYYLNNKKIQRSKIIDYMDLANAGLNQLNAVQQGTVTRISEFNDEERRKTIEDMVGLSYFDEKKAESLKQLALADQKLEIAMAKMSEVKKRIDDLEIERNQKLRYDLITRELNRYKAISAASKLKTIKSEKESKEKTLRTQQSESKKFDDERQVLRKEIAEIDKKKTEFLELVDDYTSKKSAFEQKLSVEQRNFDQAESQMIALQKRTEQIETRLPQIQTEYDEGQKEKDSIFERTSELRKKSTEILERKKQIDSQIDSLNSELRQVMKTQSQIASQKAETDNKIRNLTDKLHTAELNLGKLQSRKSDIEIKISKNSDTINSRETQTNSFDIYKNKLTQLIQNNKDTITEINSRLSKLNSRKTKLEKDIDDLSQILEKSSRAANRYAEKIKVVKSIMHEDYTISQIKDNADRLGIDGLVYENLTWDKKYERAMLSAGSDWIKAFIVPDFETLLGLAETAREKKLPKLKIIPLNSIPNFKLDTPNDPGVIGVLSDFVKCDSKFVPIRTFLFGNIILVNSKNDAYRISKSGYKTVTLDGEFFEAKASAVVVDMNSKISRLTKIISQSSSVDGLLQAIKSLKKIIQAKKLTTKKVESRIGDYHKRLRLSETDLATRISELDSFNQQMSSAINIHNKIHSRNKQLLREQEQLGTRIIQAKSAVDSLSERITLVKQNYSDPRQSQIASDIQRLNQNKTGLDQKQSEINRQYRDSQMEIGTESGNEARCKNHLRSLVEERVELNKERHEINGKLKYLEGVRDSSQKEITLLRDEEQKLLESYGTSVGDVKQFDNQLNELRKKEDSLSKQINGFERISYGLQRDLADYTKRQTEFEQILSTYGYDEKIDTYDVEHIVQKLHSEQTKLGETLNSIAPQKYIEVSDGYRSMSTRHNELEEERTNIVQFIESVDKDKRQTFLDAFDTVDKEIRGIFMQMTKGNAWLELENEDDIFNSGMSYWIQFPDKPKRGATSISGGEKTLAAIVFVLALQKLKPSPFYLFDEVDAHLDAPNSERLSKIIEERSKGSQFLMVSLKDSVVQKAKLIYGVFPKGGVSNVVLYKDKRIPSMVG